LFQRHFWRDSISPRPHKSGNGQRLMASGGSPPFNSPFRAQEFHPCAAWDFWQGKSRGKRDGRLGKRGSRHRENGAAKRLRLTRGAFLVLVSPVLAMIQSLYPCAIAGTLQFSLPRCFHGGASCTCLSNCACAFALTQCYSLTRDLPAKRNQLAQSRHAAKQFKRELPPAPFVLMASATRNAHCFTC
jgi:hypothetical protein